MYKSNSQILKNYLNIKITLYKLASALIEDWELVDKTKYSAIYDLLLTHRSRYPKQNHRIIDVNNKKTETNPASTQKSPSLEHFIS